MLNPARSMHRPVQVVSQEEASASAEAAKVYALFANLSKPLSDIC
jgi:hypothetical protein